MAENASPPSPPPSGGARPPRRPGPLDLLGSSSNRMRLLLGIEPKPPRPPPGPPLTGASAWAVKAAGSFLGAGFLPLAPGTWGSLAALALWFVGLALAQKHGLRPGLVDQFCVLAVAGFSLATLALGSLAERAAGHYDPKWFVLDELGGAFLALYGLAGYNHPQHGLWGVAFVAGAFLLFRVLDATKVGMIGWLDRRMTGGLGILMDDLFAGAAANLSVRGVAWLVAGQPFAG
ncbi:MAG TPA: phosphatidylglycerophosphatase A [Planctomycetota bacterium]|nr:phosphatidylglycerophosphatase A [Planctomycetota bacterium]